jgi:hypothetical protein
MSLGGLMVASHESVEQIVKILLKYLDRKLAHRMVRELYHKVNGNKSLMETLLRVTEKLHDLDEE